MIEFPLVILFVCILIVGFVRPPWGGLLSMAILTIMIPLLLIKLWADPGRNFASVYTFLAASTWGTAINKIVVVFRANVPQLNLMRANHPEKWALLGAVLFVMYGVGAFGYSIGLEMASSYVQADKFLYLDTKISEAVAAAFFYLGMAATVGLSALVNAITSKGLRVSSGYLVTWNQIKSYEWQGDKLVMRLNGKFLPARLRRVPVEVVSAQQEAVNQLLAQHLPGIEVQPPHPVRATI